MILSGYIVIQFDLSYYRNDESILAKRYRFKDTADLSGKGDRNGNYIIYDNKWNFLSVVEWQRFD